MSTIWFVIAGILLISVALSGTVLKRLPLTASMFYLGAGALLGPWGAGLLNLDVIDDARGLERLTEIAVIISLFTAGLKLRLPLSDRRWRNAMVLAAIAMPVTIAGIAAFGVLAAGLPLAAAVLLGAILAPTDPVLASDVQVAHEHDAEPVRFSLTGEAGLNDGTAFPFVMLALGLLGAHDLGASGWRWFAIDLVWAVGAGLAVGAICGAGVGQLVLYLRREHREAVGLDEFLALGLIALSYGVSLLVGAYGFLAVFAAGLSLRHIERTNTAAIDRRTPAAGSVEDQATHPATAPAFMARALLNFNEQLERLGELAVVLVVGALLADIETWGTGLALAFALFVVIRPAATLLTLVRARLTGTQRAFIAWFGVRGVGSIYYLAYALAHAASLPWARALADMTLVVVAASVVVHGVSVTPLMQRYSARRENRRRR
ncbi:MAG: cation:proton antiporter [Acidobacteriota bacterium]|nr:cation:proton antiporter [Acidobacteriota bacterium]